jgi:hypothetical protein
VWPILDDRLVQVLEGLVHSFYFQILVNICSFPSVLDSMKFVPDYITYQGWDDPYVPRTHEGLLKWKYANLNSVDFLFEVIIAFFCMVFWNF